MISKTNEAHQYTQMVWKASKQIGCAWSPASCGYSNAPPTFYLTCKYDPPGNDLGKFDGNVSCNNCENNTTNITPPTWNLLNSRTDIAPQIGILVGGLTQIRGSVSSVGWLDSLSPGAQSGVDDVCGFGKGYLVSPSEAVFFFSWPGSVDWNDMAQKIIDNWKSPSYSHNSIVNPNWRYVGCAWGNCGGGNYALLCWFSDKLQNKRDGNGGFDDADGITTKSTTPSITSRDNTTTISQACNPPDVSSYTDEQSIFILTLKIPIAWDRAKLGVEPAVLDWNPVLENAAKRASSDCQIDYSYGGQIVKTAIYTKSKDGGDDRNVNSPYNLTLHAIAYWRNWQEETAALHDARDDYMALTDSAVNSFGCAWSDLHACDKYILYCFFWNATCPNELSFTDNLPNLPNYPTSKRDLVQVATPAAPEDRPECSDSTGWKCLLEENFFSARVMNNVSDSHWSPNLAALAQADAETCSLHKTANSPAVEIGFMEKPVNDKDPNNTVTWHAIHAWQQPNYLNAQPDYANAINASMIYLGCGLAIGSDNTYVLNCVFSPSSNPPEALMKRTDTAITAQGPDFDLNNKTGDFFANLRQDQGLTDDSVVLEECSNLNKQTTGDARQCDNFTKKANEIWFNTSLRTISNKTSPWPEVVASAELRWYSSRFASTPEKPAAGTDYALIVDLNTKYYSCSSNICQLG